jgi:hypothetical protein
MASPLTPSCCGHLLWEDVACELPCGHIGSHMKLATPGMAMLTWRSSTTMAPPAPAASVDYLELLRATRRPLAKSA